MLAVGKNTQIPTPEKVLSRAKERDFASVHCVSAELINMYEMFRDANKARLMWCLM